ncbi:hypothetical protein H0H81_002041 [Sphagnurus paluster]|uniref:Uncharacterized protein n=1 Tax=Sphagnurus paluster TaxID=117069 RepID=A0A9P7K421_9AGAR|nr:hypothetical protein H0H81_002041 [Sphagnurus paluster]
MNTSSSSTNLKHFVLSTLLMSTTADLRHMTSTPALTSPRLSQHLRPHSPARSPGSIPSSPTSVHSSSSAIFERDIEPLCPPSPQHHSTLHPSNSHRIPRSKTTEQIEHSVPSVLDSAAAILASIDNTNDVAIVAPVSFAHNFAGSGFASPIGSFRSRSPSPTIGTLAAHGRNSLLLSIPQQQQVLMTSPATTTARAPPAIQTNVAQAAPPAIVTPTSAYFSVADGAESQSPQDTESVHPPLPSTPPPAGPSSLPAHASTSTSSPGSSSKSQPHSPTSRTHTLSQAPLGSVSVSASPNAATKRLSFVSYGDMLTSVPTSTLPLSSLTTAASAFEPPPHIPSVSVATSYPGSAATSLRGFSMAPTHHPNSTHPHPHHDAFGPTTANATASASAAQKADSVLLGMLGPGHPAGADDVGGEWEREGLGRGLAERIDVLYGAQA